MKSLAETDHIFWQKTGDQNALLSETQKKYLTV